MNLTGTENEIPNANYWNKFSLISIRFYYFNFSGKQKLIDDVHILKSGDGRL